MATCADCVHVEVCKDFMSSLIEGLELDKSDVELIKKELNQDDADKGACDHFWDRARFVELPYPIKPHDKVWYILEGLSEIDLKDYEITKGDCAVGNNPDTVIEVGTFGFWVNQLSERNEDYLVPDDCDFISWDEIGKSYFLTKEAAEQVLKEREENA